MASNFNELTPDTAIACGITALFLGGLAFARSGFQDGITSFFLTALIFMLSKFSEKSHGLSAFIATLVWIVAYFGVRRLFS